MVCPLNANGEQNVILFPAHQNPHLPTVVCFSSLALPCRTVQELLFVGCFFRFAPYGRALVWAQCGRTPHKPKGTDQTAKGGKMWPIKRKQKAKCYFAFCALKSPLTNSRYQPLGFAGKGICHYPLRSPLL